MPVHWTPRAVKDLEGLPPQLGGRIEQAVARLAETGYGDVKRLSGVWPPEWRLRVGDYRVRFRRDNKGLTILRVRHRRDMY